MKRSLPTPSMLQVLVLTLFAPVALMAQTPVVNGGFESWSSPVLFQKPAEWFTDINPNTGALSATRESESTQGDYSLKLTTVEDQGAIPNPVPVGYAVLGEFIYEFPPKGIPWNQLVDEFHVDIKYNIRSGDAGIIWVRMTNNGEVVSNKFTRLQGSRSTFRTVTLDLFSGSPVAADSIMIGIASSIPDEFNIPFFNSTPTNGSWVMVDNLRFSYRGNSYQVPNYSFESWEDFSIEEPDNWTSSNQMLTYDEKTNVVKTTDAHSGTYGAQLTTVGSILSNTPVPGLLSYGGGLLTDGGVSYTDRPLFITGAYEYESSGSDAAYIEVSFTNGSSVIGSGRIEIETSGSVGEFFLPINYSTSSNPEKVFINIFSGNNLGSVLKVDDIQLTNVSTDIEDAREEKTGIYPNPFGEVIYLKDAQNVKRVTLSSLSGQVVADFVLSGSRSSINTGAIAPGQYLITIEMIDGQKESQIAIKK